MEPTLLQGDKIFADQGYYAHHSFAEGDLVVFRHGEIILIKRISALPGEIIEGRNGILFRNGVAVVEPYAHTSIDNPMPELETFPPRQVPQGELFVTGDNRDYSLDSRSQEHGPVYKTDVLGRLNSIYSSSQGNPATRPLYQP
jgi:signal peptidase I